MDRNNTSPPSLESRAPRARALRDLRQHIESGRFRSGDVLPPERVLCEMLKISRGTLRRVLEGLEEEGFVRSTNGSKTRTVCERSGDDSRLRPRGEVVTVLASNTTVKGHSLPGWADFIALGAIREIQNAGLNVMTVGSGSFTEEDLEWILRWRPYGVIIPELAACIHPPLDLLERLQSAGIRSSVYSGAKEFAAFDRVSSDHETGIYEVTNWFLAKGRRKIANIQVKGATATYWRAARQRGYVRAMQEAGLTPLPMIEYSPHQFDSTTEQGFEAMSHYFAGWLAGPLRGAEPIDTLLLESDGFIPIIAKACQILGLVPNKDVWLGGYDNFWQEVPEMAWEPIAPMITVDKQNWQIGRQLVRLLIDRAEGRLPDEPQWQFVPPKLLETEAGLKVGLLSIELDKRLA